MKNTLEVTTTDGQKAVIEVIDIITVQGENKEYIYYKIQENDQVLISILEETNDTFLLKTIEDESELEFANDALTYLSKKDAHNG